MEDKEERSGLLESLLDKATDYGVASIELVRLKAADMTTDIVSSFIPFSLVVLLAASFLLFLNLGIALWLGDLLGKVFYGFFVVAAFYILSVIIIHFFMNKRIKRLVGNYFIKHVLKL